MGRNCFIQKPPDLAAARSCAVSAVGDADCPVVGGADCPLVQCLLWMVQIVLLSLKKTGSKHLSLRFSFLSCESQAVVPGSDLAYVCLMEAAFQEKAPRRVHSVICSLGRVSIKNTPVTAHSSPGQWVLSSPA